MEEILETPECIADARHRCNFLSPGETIEIEEKDLTIPQITDLIVLARAGETLRRNAAEILADLEAAFAVDGFIPSQKGPASRLRNILEAGGKDNLPA